MTGPTTCLAYSRDHSDECSVFSEQACETHCGQLSKVVKELKGPAAENVGFKSAKFIVRITFTEERPAATWHLEAPGEYGWYSNVYPSISHPRWSQATERRIWGDGKIERIPSRPYNGYAEHVAHLYPGSKQQYR